MTRFGPAGCPESFEQAGYKSTIQMPEYLEPMGLTAFEYQCGHGVRVTRGTAEKLGEAARARNIQISLHAPYYISMSSAEEEKRLRSVEYIIQSARAVDWMGGSRVVVHTGSCGKMSREEAMALVKDTMALALDALEREGLGHVHICPETMGKLGQLGTLEEVLELCGLDERLIPCIDFGHLNARTFGGLGTFADFEHIFDAIRDRLGNRRMEGFHVHFSKIEYTPKGGEKRHLTFADTQYGPDYRPVVELAAKRNCSLTVICESAGTQAEDAVTMMRAFEQAGGKRDE